MREILNTCPVCDSKKIKITEIECENCNAKIKSDFFCSTAGINIEDKELLNFIKIFIFTEGSIKQSERLLNCSYPKIKNLLKKSKEILQVSENLTNSLKNNTSENIKEKSNNIISELENGKIDVEEALRQLKK